MALASNLLQLIFCLLITVASLLGALFIIGFLLVEPRSEFEDDNHVDDFIIPPPSSNVTLPCNIASAEGVLPVDCEINGTESLMRFNNTLCDNSFCISEFGICDGSNDIQCCCQDSDTTSYSFTCPASGLRTVFQPASCSCQPCGDLTVTLIFVVTSASSGSPIVGAEVVINNESSPLVTDAIGITSTSRPVSDVQVSVVITATDHLDRMFTVQIVPPGPSIINVVLSPVQLELLGSSTADLTIPIGSVAIVDVPANTIVDGSGDVFDGNVMVQTVFFAVDSSDSYSDIFPSEIVTTQPGSTVTVFYQSRVIARTQLFDENDAQLNINPDTPVNVVLNFSLFDQSQNLLLSLLLFDDVTGSWSVHSNFTAAAVTTMKRQTTELTTATGPLSNTQLFWAVGLLVDPTDIIYLQVRINTEARIGGTATIFVEQFNGTLGEPFFFRSSGTIGDGSGPLGNSMCIEVLRSSSGSGTIQATFEEGTIMPSIMQPTGFTVVAVDNTVRLTGSTQGIAGGPFYNTPRECQEAVDSSFVSFEPAVTPPNGNIPPENPPPGFWYIKAQILSCFDSNRASAISVDKANQQASIFTDTATATPGAPIVSIPTDVNPSSCTGTVTARTLCLQAYSDSTVIVQAEQNVANTADGDLCYLSTVSEQANAALLGTTNFKVQLNLSTIENSPLVNDASLGIYFDADSSSVALLRCLNSANQSVSLGGSFAQFECFERVQAPLTTPVTLPPGCITDTMDSTIISQSCSEVLCTTPFGLCASNSGTQCCYRQDTRTATTNITCPPLNSFVLTQPEVCSCQSCEDIIIDIEITVTSAADMSPIMGTVISSDNGELMMTNTIGMLTIPAPVSQDTITFNITAPNHQPSTLTINLIPPGPIRISVTLNTITTETNPSNQVIDVGGIATSTYSLTNVMGGDGQVFTGEIMSRTFFFAQKNPGSCGADSPPAVVTFNGPTPTFYAVRIIASTELMDTSANTLMSTAVVNTSFTEDNGQPDGNALELLVINATDPNDQWRIESSVNVVSSAGDIEATADLSDTNLLWAIASPLTVDRICYVQVRTFSRGGPLSGADVTIKQFITQFGRPFFFRQSRTTEDTSGPVSHSACLPVLCGNVDSGTIRATDQTFLNANQMQPAGLTPMGTTIAFTSSTEGSPPSPFFTTEEDCRAASSGPYTRFDLPIPNPPSDNPIKPDVTNGYWYFRVQVYECLESNVVTTISADSDNNLLGICSRTITETEDYSIPEDVDPAASGGGAISCTANFMNVTTRVACIRAINASNVTLQVELNMDSAMITAGNEFCTLNNTVSDFMNFDQMSDQISVDLTAYPTGGRPDLGIYFDESSDALARNRCMAGTFNGTLNGTMAIFSCFL